MLHTMLPDLAKGGETGMTPPSMSRPLIACFFDAGLDKEARDSNGNTPVFGYVAKQPTFGQEYSEFIRPPDLHE